MKRTYTIEEIENQPDNAPLWVVNRSGEHEFVKQLGEIVLQIPIPDQNPEQIILPASWLPVNLTERVQRKHLVAATNLRRYYMEGLIMFVTPQYAQLLNDHEGAKEEREELRSRRSRIHAAATAKTLDETPVKIMMGDNMDSAVNVFSGNEPSRRGKLPVIEDPEIPEFSEAFSTWKVDASKLNDIQTLNSLRSKGRSFSRDELQDLVDSNALSSKPKTLASVRRNLAKRT